MAYTFVVIDGKKIYQDFLGNTKNASKENFKNDERTILSLKRKLQNQVDKLDKEFQRLGRVKDIFTEDEEPVEVKG